MIREDLSEVEWSDHVGGGCEAHGGPPRASRVANHVSEVRKKGLNGRFMRRDFNHEHWLPNLDRLDMTHGGSGGDP